MDTGSHPDHEFGFELRVCAWAERNWSSGDDGDAPAVVVGRQVGTRHRRWDTVVVETTPEKLRRRANFGADALDSDLLHVVRHAPPEWRWYREALPEPEYPWRYVREAVHRAAGRDILETRRRRNRIELRRNWPYPDWADRVVAIENKPDLDASAAAALADQLERDIAVGLADEAWVATRATGDRPPALFEDIPVEAGVLAVGDGEATVEWHPRTLADGPGTRILERPGGGEHDSSAARFEYVDPAELKATRRELAERVYGRGWRSYVETMRPDCRHFSVARAEHGYVPRCEAKACQQTAAECAGSCPDFEPEPPGWRSRGWPLEGGPGATVQRVLESRRARARRRSPTR